MHIFSMAEDNKPAQIDIYCQLPEKAINQSLLYNLYSNLKIAFKAIASIKTKTIKVMI